MHFPDYSRPLPAHSPIPAHLKANSTPSSSSRPAQPLGNGSGGVAPTSTTSGPPPAHVSRNPYQPTANYHSLSAPHQQAYGHVAPPPPPPPPQHAANYPGFPYHHPHPQMDPYGYHNHNSAAPKPAVPAAAPYSSGLSNGGGHYPHQQPRDAANPLSYVSKASAPPATHTISESVESQNRAPSQPRGPTIEAGNAPIQPAVQPPVDLTAVHQAGQAAAAAPAAPKASSVPSVAPASSSSSYLPTQPVPMAPTAKQPKPKIAHSVASQLNNNGDDGPNRQQSSLPNEERSGAASPAAGNKFSGAGWKRKNSFSGSGGDEGRPRKKILTSASSSVSASSTPPILSAADDPYSFDEEEKVAGSGQTGVEFGRFFSQSGKSNNGSTASGGGGSGGGGSVAAGPVYKFKSALLSREHRTSSTESRSSGTSSTAFNKTVPMAFDKGEDTFVEVCDRFLEDLSTKTVAISRRPSMDAYRERMAARAEKKAERKMNKLKKKMQLEDAAGEENDDELTIDTMASPESSKHGAISPSANDSGDISNPSSVKSTPTKKKPGRKSKSCSVTVNDNPSVEVADGADDTKEARTETGPGHKKPPAAQQQKPKKGGLWALPIVPKLPQKPPPTERRRSPVPPKPKEVDLSDIWRQAFGGDKGKKGAAGGTSSPGSSARSSSPMSHGGEKIKQEPLTGEKKKKRKRTILDVPPEVRRRPKPSYGGLIHFAPDWEAKVKKHHVKCRMPGKLLTNMKCIKPKVLSQPPSAALKNLESTPSSVQPIAVSPNAAVVASTLPLSSPNPIQPKDASDESASTSAPVSIVDSILEKRKLRKRVDLSALHFYKKPRVKTTAFEQLPEEKIGLIMTPGMPLLSDDNSEAKLMSLNFRRQTLLRYLDSLEDGAELKAKILDWKPEVYETKTRRQSNQVKVATGFKEIFGIDLPEAKAARNNEAMGRAAAAAATPSPAKSECPSTPSTSSPTKSDMDEEWKTPKKAASKKKQKATNTIEIESSQQQQKKLKVKAEDQEPAPQLSESQKSLSEEDTLPLVSSDETAPPAPPPLQQQQSTSRFVEDDYIPNEREEELQVQLQNFALDLLDENPSWSNKTVIQNLVIWEPVGPVIPEKKIYKKKSTGKRHKKRASGLDFSNAGKKKSAKSREASRAGTPERDAGESHAISYTLDQVISESKGWVVDKGAGETILQRASKMGYPDVVAYAVDLVGMNPSLKDNAGIPPIHKAAFKGHSDIVKILLRYGVDPNTNVKGTRPLHEALMGGDAQSVFNLLQFGSDPLIYDYSGNMPMDLAEDNDDLKRYLTAVLADLHGKDDKRYNVSHDADFILPKEDKKEGDDDDDLLGDFDFESSSHALPPFFQFADRDGSYLLVSDLKSYLHSRLDMKRLETIVDMSREDFTRTAHCCLLGYNGYAKQVKEDIVQLVLVDDGVKKMLGVDATNVKGGRRSPSPTPSSPKARPRQPSASTSKPSPSSSRSRSPSKKMASAPATSSSSSPPANLVIPKLLTSPKSRRKL